MRIKLLFFIVLTLGAFKLNAQHSMARNWNELLLEHIRDDFARPTVHARNLFHSSLLMYDAWAVFDDKAETVFLGKNFGNHICEYTGIAIPENKEQAINEIISYGMFRLLEHRFSNASAEIKQASIDLFSNLGYDTNFTTTDYSNGSYAALGNYLASQIIAFGFTDGANEANNYENQYYQPINPPLNLNTYNPNTDIDVNRWQPLAFDVFIDQSGNEIVSGIPNFIGAEWGQVIPFSLTTKDLEVLYNGYEFNVYNNPGAPYYIQNSDSNGIEDPYKWNFSLVLSWSSHLDPEDETLIDISPKTIGNITNYPENFEAYKLFYDFTEGGDWGSGHELNPHTNMPYESQIVKRADYARVLAEFWADGPDSETPPGHWFTIFNYVNDHELTVKRINGAGEEVSDLEWDVKGYLMLGGAMHDVAVNTWGIKGYYDYVRPISAIRYMAAKGQSTDNTLTNFDPHGLPLIDGLIEVIEEGDLLSGMNNENVGKIKVKAWKGSQFIENPENDIAGVDWILGTHWWSYQRPTFVTPPFAGYLSGHSTFSSAGAKILELFTGDPFFPGGLGTFSVEENEFLVFEKGPTESFSLQWATYKDAADQSSLSRIWGGIHPPEDDIKGRILGEKIGRSAFDLANKYFKGEDTITDYGNIYPIPFNNAFTFESNILGKLTIEVYDIKGTLVHKEYLNKVNPTLKIDLSSLSSGIYLTKMLSHSQVIIDFKRIIKK